MLLTLLFMILDILNMPYGRNWISYGPVRAHICWVAIYTGIYKATVAGQVLETVYSIHNGHSTVSVLACCGIFT